SFAPGPNQAFQQKEEKYQDRDEGAEGQPGKGNGEWDEENRFNVEDEENDAVKIELRLKLDLRLALRFNPAFIGRVLRRARFRCLEEFSPKPGQGERRDRKNERHAAKDDEKKIRIRRHARIFANGWENKEPQMNADLQDGRKPQLFPSCLCERCLSFYFARYWSSF